MPPFLCITPSWRIQARTRPIWERLSFLRKPFAQQIELLARRFRPTSLDQVEQFINGEGEIPDRAVVVTFDDGYTDNYEIAAPVLNELGVPATFYATVECVDRQDAALAGAVTILFS